MNNFFEQFKNEGQKIRMSDAEKLRMRKILQAHMHGQAHVTKVASPYFHFSFQFTRIIAAMLVMTVGLVGTGTVYAADLALPGDTLYPVKINVNEKVAEVLATSPAAKAEFHASVAQKRLEEAETLAVEERLDASASLVIEENFERHAKMVAELEEELEDDTLAAELDSSLAVHGEILVQLSSASEHEDTKENSSRIASRVRERSQRQWDKPDAEAAVATLVTATAPAEAEDAAPAPATMTLKIADEATSSAPLTQARADLRTAGRRLDEDTKTRVEERLEDIEALLDEGEYREALQASIQLSALLKAEQRLGRKFLESLLPARSDSGVKTEGEVRGSATSTATTTDEVKEEKTDTDEGEEGDRDNRDDEDDNSDRDERDGRSNRSKWDDYRPNFRFEF
jgi:hypothetical protein